MKIGGTACGRPMSGRPFFIKIKERYVMAVKEKIDEIISSAAAGAGDMVIHELIAHFSTAGGEAGQHGRKDDAVFEFRLVDGDRRKQHGYLGLEKARLTGSCAVKGRRGRPGGRPRRINPYRARGPWPCSGTGYSEAPLPGTAYRGRDPPPA